ncbi:uncharacterized protein [Aegilops tauschii subsp. strangulata]|uniref:uncharacterized protein n=1 Tax=Aegilops tauschii subsp. strangulata TaxID=200361 RepID=UPI001ABC34A1|nr:sulfated surface glycoprotein 185 [Aegilops tauschii subsp. strangulata]
MEPGTAAGISGVPSHGSWSRLGGRVDGGMERAYSANNSTLHKPLKRTAAKNNKKTTPPTAFIPCPAHPPTPTCFFIPCPAPPDHPLPRAAAPPLPAPPHHPPARRPRRRCEPPRRPTPPPPAPPPPRPRDSPLPLHCLPLPPAAAVAQGRVTPATYLRRPSTTQQPPDPAGSGSTSPHLPLLRNSAAARVPAARPPHATAPDGLSSTGGQPARPSTSRRAISTLPRHRRSGSGRRRATYSRGIQPLSGRSAPTKRSAAQHLHPVGSSRDGKLGVCPGIQGLAVVRRPPLLAHPLLTLPCPRDHGLTAEPSTVCGVCRCSAEGACFVKKKDLVFLGCFCWFFRQTYNDFV